MTPSVCEVGSSDLYMAASLDGHIQGDINIVALQTILRGLRTSRNSREYPALLPWRWAAWGPMARMSLGGAAIMRPITPRVTGAATQIVGGDRLGTGGSVRKGLINRGNIIAFQHRNALRPGWPGPHEADAQFALSGFVKRRAHSHGGNRSCLPPKRTTCIVLRLSRTTLLPILKLPPGSRLAASHTTSCCAVGRRASCILPGLAPANHCSPRSVAGYFLSRPLPHPTAGARPSRLRKSWVIHMGLFLIIPRTYLKKSPIFSPETAATSFDSPRAPTTATRRNQEMMHMLYGILILRIPLQPWDHIAFALSIKKGTTRPPLLGRLSNRASTCNAVSLLSESSQHCAQSSAVLLDNLRPPGLLFT